MSFTSVGTAASVEDGRVRLSYTGPDGTPQLFQCTNAAVSYTVPAGVTSSSVVAAGGAGGEGPRAIPQAGAGGHGAVRRVLLDVTPGVTYKVVAGCKGARGGTSDLFSGASGGQAASV
jgi:hypothetical protein